MARKAMTWKARRPPGEEEKPWEEAWSAGVEGVVAASAGCEVEGALFGLPLPPFPPPAAAWAD